MRLAYYRGTYDDGGASQGSALYVLDVETGQETQLTQDDTFSGDSDWSLHDEWLVFSTYPLIDFECCQVSNLFRIHPDGTGLQQLTEYQTPQLRAIQPRYTPDGAWILFTAARPNSRGLWALPADGGEPVVIAPGGIYTHGTWQPK